MGTSSTRKVRAADLVGVESELRIHVTTNGETVDREFSHAEFVPVDGVPNRGVYIYCSRDDGILYHPLGLLQPESEVTVSDA